MKTQRRLVCENSRFSVYLDDWRHGDKRAQDYLVVAPKIAGVGLVTGVAVLPVFEGKFGLLRIFRHAIEAECWEIPRGFVEEGESEAASALRELTEETGLACAPAQLQSLGFVAPDAGVLAARVHLFAAFNCRVSEQYRPEEFGHSEFYCWTAPQVEELIASGEIQDPTTLVAYYKFLRIKNALITSV